MKTMGLESGPLTSALKPRDVFISISLALYIFSSYVTNTPLGAAFGSAALYAFLGLTFLKLITRQAPLRLLPYSLWYFTFGVLASLSLLYATEKAYVFTGLYTLLVSWVVTFSFIQYVRDESSIRRIFSFFAYFPIPLVLYLLLSGELDTQGARLGETFFDNANKLAMVMMVTLFGISWFIVYGRSRSLWFNVPLAIIFLYIIGLTGGRKFFSIPFVFFLLLLVLKFQREKKLSLLVSILFFFMALFVIAWAVTNVPALHGSIGIRFAGLFNLLNGGPSSADASTRIRYILIENGWRWFAQRPLFGYGLNNFQGMFAQLGRVSYAHNNYIELLVDLGLSGALLYYSFYALLLARLIRIRNDLSGIRDFFFALILVLPLFELGAVTYNLNPVQVLMGLAASYAWLPDRNRIVAVK